MESCWRVRDGNLEFRPTLEQRWSQKTRGHKAAAPQQSCSDTFNLCRSGWAGPPRLPSRFHGNRIKRSPSRSKRTSRVTTASSFISAGSRKLFRTLPDAFFSTANGEESDGGGARTHTHTQNTQRLIWDQHKRKQPRQDTESASHPHTCHTGRRQKLKGLMLQLLTASLFWSFLHSFMCFNQPFSYI